MKEQQVQMLGFEGKTRVKERHAHSKRVAQQQIQTLCSA